MLPMRLSAQLRTPPGSYKNCSSNPRLNAGGLRHSTLHGEFASLRNQFVDGLIKIHQSIIQLELGIPSNQIRQQKSSEP